MYMQYLSFLLFCFSTTYSSADSHHHSSTQDQQLDQIQLNSTSSACKCNTWQADHYLSVTPIAITNPDTFAIPNTEKYSAAIR